MEFYLHLLVEGKVFLRVCASHTSLHKRLAFSSMMTFSLVLRKEVSLLVLYIVGCMVGIHHWLI